MYNGVYEDVFKFFEDALIKRVEDLRSNLQKCIDNKRIMSHALLIFIMEEIKEICRLVMRMTEIEAKMNLKK